MRTGTAAAALLAALALFLLPREALAWGPVAHLDVGLELLAGSAPLAAALLRRINRHSFDFLYGCLAADLIVGKNRAAWHEHSHNWRVARRLLEDAREVGEATEVMMLGYLSHLGADVVAHNHVVPQQLVRHFGAKGHGHLYWEARADRKLMRELPEVRRWWAELSRLRFLEHDRFLARRLAPTLLANNVSRTLYRRGLALQRRGPWVAALGRIERGSRLDFPTRELWRWRTLAVEGARRAVSNPASRRLDRLDPTGAAALASAQSHRRSLRRLLRRRPPDREALESLYAHALAATQTVDIHHFERDFGIPPNDAPKDESKPSR